MYHGKLLSKYKIKRKGVHNMAEKLDGNKIAMLTGIAIQDDETFKSEGGFIPERKFLKSAINGGCGWLHFTEMISLW